MSVSSAVNAPGARLVNPPLMITIRHATCAPVLKGYVGSRSDWFISRYAQTTPMNNEATSDQPLLDLRQTQEPFDLTGV